MKRGARLNGLGDVLVTRLFLFRVGRGASSWPRDWVASVVAPGIGNPGARLGLWLTSFSRDQRVRRQT